MLLANVKTELPNEYVFTGSHVHELPEWALTVLDPWDSHGLELIEVGGQVKCDPSINSILAAAAVTPTEALVVFNGKTIRAPIAQINPAVVELACNEKGCVLIPKDKNPFNDLVVNSDGQVSYLHFDGEKVSSHKIEILEVGGTAKVDPSVHPILAAAAVSPTEALVQFNGKTMRAPIAQINVAVVELACSEKGCVLIPRDKNPFNDLEVSANG